MHPMQLGHVKTSCRCTLAQRWANVAFSTTFIKNQSGRHTLVQCGPNVMHPTQLSHVKISHWCTLAQRWANVLIPTSYRSDCQWQNVNVWAMLGNVVLPTPTIGQPYYPIPTLVQHSHAIWAEQTNRPQTASMFIDLFVPQSESFTNEPRKKTSFINKQELNAICSSC